MLMTMARGAYLLLMAVMIASYAASLARSSAPEPKAEPKPDQQVWRMYS